MLDLHKVLGLGTKFVVRIIDNSIISTTKALGLGVID